MGVAREKERKRYIWLIKRLIKIGKIRKVKWKASEWEKTLKEERYGGFIAEKQTNRCDYIMIISWVPYDSHGCWEGGIYKCKDERNYE